MPKMTVPAGMMWIYGKKPSVPAPAYEGTFSEQMRLWALSYKTTEEGIRAMLPDPLEAIPGVDEVMIFAGWAPHVRFINGEQHTYCEVGWWIPCQYKGERGLHMAITYMDSSSHDQADGGYMGATTGREIFGYVKTVATVNLDCLGSKMSGTVDRRGVRLVSMHLDFVEEAEPSVDMFKAAGFNQFLFVKEIPNCDFTGYDVRKVTAFSLDRMWDNVASVRYGTGRVEYGHLDSDPVDVLKVVTPGRAIEVVSDIRSVSDWLGAGREIEDLLK
ncbi:acetoacetate decarboxylase family protein [Castellaniella sp. GW247-6E4]|uniref:acetoacetate decarboxylase family protein n=1 Tax=Castellaniella sp. GW247-6E4 TaxID=3140380 RepID=UPI0033159384